jgi:hypothetical protein
LQVYISKSLNSYRIDGVKHSFTALSDKFGHGKPIEDVFEMFGEFEKGQRDVLFDVSFEFSRFSSSAKLFPIHLLRTTPSVSLPRRAAWMQPSTESSDVWPKLTGRRNLNE